MWGFHCSVNERSWKCWQMQMGAREILHLEIQRFYERNSKIENHFKTKNVKPTKHNHAKLKSIVFFLSQTLFVFAGQDWIEKLSCGSLWLTDFKVLVTNSGRNRCNVSNWHWQHMLRGRSVLQRWFTERGRVKSTIEIDLKFIRAGGWLQKKEKDLLMGNVILTPG